MGLRLAYLRLTMTYYRGRGKGYINFESEFHGDGNKHGKNYYCHEIVSHVWASDLHVYILPSPILKGKVKVMNISTANTLEMTTNRLTLLLPSSRMSRIDFRLVHLQLSLANNKGQG